MTHDSPDATPVFPGAASPQSVFIGLLRLYRDDSGQDIVEYALIASFMGLGTVAGVHGLAASVAGYFNTILNAFESATQPYL